MSVPVYRRQESLLEVVVMSNEIQKILIDLIQRNLGIKRFNKMIMRDHDYGIIESDKTQRVRFLVDASKKTLYTISVQLVGNIRSANSIDGSNSLAEYELRRSYQNMALCNCQDMIAELQNIIDAFNLDINRYETITNVIYREIDLIKRWRQRDNRMKKRIKCVV